MRHIYTSFIATAAMLLPLLAQASKLVEFKVMDKDYLVVYFKDGDTKFDESKTGAAANEIVYYGTPLNTANAANTSSWTIKSLDDANYSGSGKSPSAVSRKSKICGMSQESWNDNIKDYNYDLAFEHYIYLKLPNSMQSGKTYTLEINPNTNSDKTAQSITFDIFNSISDAIKVNLVGYKNTNSLKAADVYMWMGDGGKRDYTSFIGNKVFVYDVNSKTSTEIGTLRHFANEATETTHGHKMLMSDVWTAEFSSFTTPGSYRIAIEGIGCSQDFTIASNIYRDPFQISTLGYFYMRIGEAAPGIDLKPRTPLYIPGVDPSNCIVYITDMSPYHPEWNTFSGGDRWDAKEVWDPYVKPGRPTNPNAYGGHSDAKDWDRHLAHVSNIYDMLLPYFLSNGAIADDDLGITESGNGIPDIIDEARNEVDFWLRLRYGKGYSHGLNNPTKSDSPTPNVFYQADNTPMAAWANAANAAMISNCFMISGHNDLMAEYRDSAINAFNYATALSDKMLNTKQEVGSVSMTGNCFRITAAAFLYNVTGNTGYEDVINEVSRATGTNPTICDGNFNQIYATAAYLFTPQTINYPSLHSNMKASIINEAKNKEANYSKTRPSRRGSDNTIGWFQTELMMQRSMIAHAITQDNTEKQLFEDALISEADWTLGRNPLNMVQMSTATTNMKHLKNAENQYTSGWDDGVEGIHPGHTPYMNIFDWGGTMIMGKPTWMGYQNYPPAFAGSETKPSTLQWPYGELYYNTRYVYAANEFTPRQTMRGKMALYGYLYSLSGSCDRPNLGADQTICGKTEIILNSGIATASFTWKKDGQNISGANQATLTITEPGEYSVTTNIDGCINSDLIVISGSMPEIDLGNEVTLCSPSFATLSIENLGEGITYTWLKDGIELTDKTSNEITVANPGIYTITAESDNCPAVSSQVNVKSKLLKANGIEICNAGTALLEIEDEGGTYNWYETLTGGTSIYTGTQYSVHIDGDKTFYVEDASGSVDHLGPASPAAYSDSVWGSWTAALEYKIKFNVIEALSFKSVTIYNRAATSITCRILGDDKTTIIKTVTIPAIEGANIIEFNIDLAPGTYFIDPVGTDGAITLNGNNTLNGSTVNPAYTTFSGEALEFAGTDPAWIGEGNRWWLYFYDWVIATGNVCDRTPVEAIINPESELCNQITQTIELQAGWNLISTNVHPTDSSIATLFNGLDVIEIKDMNTYWRKDQPSYLNLLQTIAAGEGYLVKMNAGER
jgi:endoglucanase